MENIIVDVGKGVPWKVSAVAHGLPLASLGAWLKRGRELQKYMAERGAFPSGAGKLDWLLYDLAYGIDKAQADMLRRHWRKVDASAKKNPGLAIHMIEKRNRQDMEEVAEGSSLAPAVIVYAPANSRGGKYGK